MPSLRAPGIGPNPIHPESLTQKERLGELCHLLALGILRLRARDHAKAGQSSRLFPESETAFGGLSCPGERSCNPLDAEKTEKGVNQPFGQIGATDPILARLAALKTMPAAKLKEQWRELFGTEPPPYNRPFLESRLAYRIQEEAYSGLKPETVRRLQQMGEELDGGDIVKRRARHDRKPIVGTRLVREWRGTEHVVTVLADGFEWQRRPYRSLSAIARAITGTRWNGPLFFGIANHRRRG